MVKTYQVINSPGSQQADELIDFVPRICNIADIRLHTSEVRFFLHEKGVAGKTQERHPL